MSIRLSFTIVLVSAIALPAQIGSNDRALHALRQWDRRYRSGRLRFSLEAHYLQFACARATILRTARRKMGRKMRAGPEEIVHHLTMYRLGKIDGIALARFIRGRAHVRRIKNLDSFADLLLTFHRAALADASGEVLKSTAGIFIRIATHAFGGSLAAEGDRWGVYRPHHPLLVRREARNYLSILANRSSRVREFLLDVARGKIEIAGASLNASEVAITCLSGLNCSSLGEEDRYTFSRAMAEILTGEGNFWVQLAAGRLLSRFHSSYHGHILAMSLAAVSRRIEKKRGSPGAMVGLAVAGSSGAHLAWARKEGRLKAEWAGVSTDLRTLTAELLRVVRDDSHAVKLRRRALVALEAAHHWHTVHALVNIFRSMPEEALKAEVLKTLQRLTDTLRLGPEDWLRWYDRHRAGEKGAVKIHRYDDPEPVRFYGIPIVGERILFVVDTSGSMGDPLVRRPGNQQERFSKIGRTRSELIAAIEGLSDRRRFNVLLFADSVASLFKGLVHATKKNRMDAVNRIRGLSGSGWTCFGDAVLAAFGKERIGQPVPLPLSPGKVKHASTRGPGYPDQIILLSDGMPSKGLLFLPEDFLEEIARLNKGLGIRIDTVALGHESNPFLLEEMAHQNGGTLVVYPEAFAAAYRKLEAGMK